MEQAAKAAGWKGYSNVQQLHYRYPKLKDMAQEVLLTRAKVSLEPGDKLSFADFSELVLGRPMFRHMHQWVEWFEDPDQDHILILVPPECAKTTKVLDYIAWRIYRDPEIRVGYASRTLPQATKYVSRLRNVLASNRTLHQLMGGSPVPGPGDPHPWRDTAFTVVQREWTMGQDEADYTVAAYGAGSQITGSRFDLLIFDDPDDVMLGPSQRETIWNTILQSGETRLGTAGRMIVIGNRQHEEDVYRKILDQWEEDPELWAVNIQSAIESEPTEADPHAPLVVFWPEKFGRTKEIKSTEVVKPVLEEDLPNYVQRAYEFFCKKRKRLSWQNRFWLVYQNAPRSDFEKDFPRALVDGALDANETWEKAHPASLIINAMDPAPSGGAAVLVYALLPPCEHGIRRRKIIDFEWGMNWRQPGCMSRIEQYGSKYRPKFWVIDRQGGNKFFTDDPVLQKIIQHQGAHLIDITTGANKNVGDFAVSSLRDLFEAPCECGPRLILPGMTPGDKELTKPLRDQLVNYHPETTYPHDGPMTLWYAERLIREHGLDRRPVREERNRTVGWTSPYGGDSWRGGSWRLRPAPSAAPAPGSLVQSPTKPSNPIAVNPR